MAVQEPSRHARHAGPSCSATLERTHGILPAAGRPTRTPLWHKLVTTSLAAALSRCLPHATGGNSGTRNGACWQPRLTRLSWTTESPHSIRKPSTMSHVAHLLNCRTCQHTNILTRCCLPATTLHGSNVARSVPQCAESLNMVSPK